MNHRPLVLIILDGFGDRSETENNAVLASAKTFGELRARYPHAQLSASGKEVGLPLGLMGNSEVGHLNMGAGRVVYQDISRIDKSIADGEFDENGAIVGLLDQVRASNKKLHLLGLVSDGGVHASDKHLNHLLGLAARKGLSKDQVKVHAILDGRDTPPRSGVGYVEALQAQLQKAGVGSIASLCGRYYAMDRDKRWERTQKAYDLYTAGKGEPVDSNMSAAELVQQSYAKDVSDEFLLPHLLDAAGRFEEGDAVLCFNYRADRMRQICLAFSDPDFDGFERALDPRPSMVTMTQYRADFPFPVAFPPRELKGLFPEIISANGLRQERIAETEKYAHVTYFFSGGKEAELPGESRTLIPSPRVATYDLQPEMNAPLVCDAVLRSLEKGETDVYIINFANADMVGHTGIWDAACAAIQAVDQCLARIVPEVTKRGGLCTITADHGNAEMLWDGGHDQPHTAHTTNPVPVLLCADDLIGAKLRPMGILADVAPTLLDAAGLSCSPEMDGVSLFETDFVRTL